MNIKTFIDRPIFSIGISIFIVLFGVISLVTLPIEQYPNIAPPSVSVTTMYPGASADAIQNSVIAPLEEAINGVENMMYMTSSASSSGEVNITVYFNQGTDADMAAVNVQNRVSIASGTLPAEVLQIGVTTQKQQPSNLRIFSVISPNGTYDENFISNYVNINLKPEIQRISGVAAVTVYGSNYSIRIWLDPIIMTQYKLVPSDISALLAEQNIEMATGSFGENSGQVFQYTMKYSGRKQSVEEFEQIVVRALPDGEVLHLKDIARIELGSDSYFFSSKVNGGNGISAVVNQTAGSNATAINLEIDKLFERAKDQMPNDLEIVTIQNTNDFLFASIESVVISLVLAIILVFVVVYFFLQDFRATLIPTICIIVSLIGTFAFLSVAGFSLNLLTLFALVLVIGTVVDNAIVVVEAVQARFDSGYKSPYKATIDAMDGLLSALFTTTLVFMAVFIPVAFMGGTTGIFYTQFGLTMAVAVGLSFINSLTLSPALCAIMLKPNPELGKGSRIAARVRKAYNTSYNAMLKRYTKGAMYFIRRKALVFGILIVSIIGLGYMMMTTKQGFVPSEDIAMVLVDVSISPGSTSDQTNAIFDEIYASIHDIPEFSVCAQVVGFGLISGVSSNAGSFFISLKDWSEREGYESSAQGVIEQIYARTAHIKSANIFALAPGMIPGYGEGGGFEFHTQNRTGADIKEFYNVTQEYLAKLQARPEIDVAFSSYNINYPQYIVDVDAAKCKRAGVSPRDVLSVIGGYYGSFYASNFNRFSKVYRVMIQAEPDARKNEETLNNIYVRIGNEMAPVAQFVSLTKVYDPVELRRFNLYPSIGVNGAIAAGYSSGDAIRAIKELASTELPRGYTVDYSGMTREEEKGGNTTYMVFAICFVFIFVLMSMLYESYFIPLAVILSIPFGLLGSFAFANIMGLENNIYLQVGLIMLIGLLAKTAILLTEYATQCRKAGMSIKQSAFFSAKVRMRPILMTALTMIFGMLPLMFANGVGAVGNRTIGSGAVGGMIVGTLALLFIVPALFVIFQTLQEKFKPITQFEDPTDPMIIAEMKLIEEYKSKKTKKMAIKIKNIILVLLVFMMSSCGIYTNFNTPEIEKENFVGEQFALPDSALVNLPTWNDYFVDTILQTYIRSALEVNSDVRIALLNIDQAQRAVKTARLAYLPTVSFAPDGSVSSFNNSATVASYNLPLVASWEIDLFGRIRNQKEQVRVAYEQSCEYVEMVRTQIIAAVAANYYALILTDIQLQIAKESQQIISESLETMLALKDVGMQTQVAVDQTIANLKAFELTIKDLEKSVTLAENSLCLLLNITPQKIARNLQIEVPVSPIKESISLAALSARPDVRSAELQLAQSFYGVNYARASLYPSIRLSGSAGWTNNAGVILNPGAMLFSALGSLTQPIFMAGVNKANLENAEDRYEQNLIAFKKSLLTAGKEVNDAIIEDEITDQKTLIAKEQIERLNSAVEATNALMSAGRANYLEVLSAQNNYLSAKLNAASITYSKAIAQINLYKALGGGRE